MGILDKIKGKIFRKKEDLEPPMADTDIYMPTPTIPEGTPRTPRDEILGPTPLGSLRPSSRVSAETEKIDMSNVRAKLDLLITQMDGLRSQNQIISERLNNIERTLAEMRGIRRY